MMRATLILPDDYELDLDDIEAVGIVHDALEAKHGAMTLAFRRRANTPRPIVVIDGDRDADHV